MGVVGFIDEVSRARVVGWVADTDAYGAPVTVSISVNNVEVGRSIADKFRPGLKEALGGGSNGRHEFQFQFPEPLSVYERHRVTIACNSAPRFEFPPYDGLFLPPSLKPASVYPVVITSVGRSGSTVLMKSLSKHPQLVIAEQYPYEIKLLGYYLSALRVLSSEEDRENSTHPDRMFVDENRYRIGHNPYNAPILLDHLDPDGALKKLFKSDLPNALAQTFRDAIQSFYITLRSRQNKFSANLFVEKGILEKDARRGVKALFDRSYEVVLVRDARDLVCSAMAFWGRTFSDVVDDLSTSLNSIVDIAAEPKGSSLTVRYEDMVTDQARTIRIILEYLGIERGFNFPIEEVIEGHSTSKDVKSVGRWRRDLSPAEVEICNQRFARYQAAFGYEGVSPARLALG